MPIDVKRLEEKKKENNKAKNTRDLVKFSRKLRTVYINKRGLSDLFTLLKKELKENKAKMKNDAGNLYAYHLGNSLKLVDIRWNTYYKSKRILPDNEEQHFGPENLKRLCQKEPNIEYWRIKPLGNPPNRKILRNEKKRPSKIKNPNKYERFLEKELKNALRARTFYLNYIEKKFAIINNKKYYPEVWLNKLFDSVDSQDPNKIHVLLCYCDPPKFLIRKPTENLKSLYSRLSKVEKGFTNLYCHRFWLRAKLINLKREQLEFTSTYLENQFIKEEGFINA
jgi:hypothetical protein